MSLNAVAAAEAVHHAITGWGTDDKALIELLGRRPNWHLQKVREEYEKKYQKDMLKKVESDVSGNYKKLILDLIRSRSEVRADDVYKAIKGLGTDEHALIDVIFTCPWAQVQEFKQFFRQKYEQSVDDFVKGDTSGNFERVLLDMLDRERVQGIQQNLVEADADLIFNSGEARWGTDDKKFVEIFTARSAEHLQAVSQKYNEKHGHDLAHAITHETSGWYKISLLATLETPVTYWAKRIKAAVKGLGTDDRALVRAFGTNSKPFLHEVAKEYQTLFNVSIVNDVDGDTSGNYKKIIDILLDLPEHERQQY